MEATLSQIHPPVAELRAGQRFEGRYACLSKERQTSRSGSGYLAVRLRDRTGMLHAKVFRDADRIGLRFDPGDAVAVRGKVESFRGELVAELSDVTRLEPESYRPEEFLPAAYRSVEELEGFLEHLIREVHDPALGEIVERVLIRGETAEAFRRVPCTRSSHHAYLGGLIEHTVAVATLVGELCQLHPRLDSDLLMAAALLHDVGKTREFVLAADFEVSEEGAMLGHLAIGAEIIGAVSGSLPAERRLRLLNCVLSHHGPHEGPAAARERGRGAGVARAGFGSAEALALYRLNALDASVKGALEHGGA